MKWIVSFICLIAFFNAKAIDLTFPSDVLTLEALIANHKLMKKNEDISMVQVTTITAEQMVSTNFADSISTVKQTLNKKMSDVNSYLVLATTLSNTAFKLSNLVDEYSDFITVIAPIAAKKPFVAVYYASTQKRIIKEIEKLSERILSYSAVGFNVLKASMDEKFRLLAQIDSSISVMRNLISRTSNYIVYSNRDGIELLNVSDIISDDSRAAIADKLIQEWKNTKF